MSKNALQLAEYTLEGGQVLTADTVRRYISKEANEQEILMFIELCKAQKLNPFIKEVDGKFVNVKQKRKAYQEYLKSNK